MASERLQLSAELWRIRLRKLLRATLGLAGLACVLVGAMNMLTGSSMFAQYRVFGAVLTPTSGYYIGDVLLIGGGAVLAWFSQ